MDKVHIIKQSTFWSDSTTTENLEAFLSLDKAEIALEKLEAKKISNTAYYLETLFLNS